VEMLVALCFCETFYGLGAGFFFFGFVLCGLPSYLALFRFGPRGWIGLMMMTWGVFSACGRFVTTPVELCLLRCLAGVGEA
ncbi:MFS transporter, partial [Pseudomonas syringae pv. tagetis]